MPWWPVWLSSRGLTDVEIADLLAFERLIIVAASLTVAHFADKTGHRRKFLIMFAVGMTIGYTLFSIANFYWHYLIIAAFTGICRSPLIPLSDSITMTHVRRLEADYGKVRLWGTISFILGSFLGGVILEDQEEAMILVAIVVSSIFAAWGFFFLPDTRSEGNAPRLLDGVKLATRPIFILFIVTIALSMSSHSAVYTFGSLYWRGLGIPEVQARHDVSPWNRPFRGRGDPICIKSSDQTWTPECQIVFAHRYLAGSRQ